MRLILGTIFTFFWTIGFSQQPLPSFINFTVEDGLPTSEIYDAIQDEQGYIWFATDRGIVKYNGYEFVTYTTEDGLLDNVVFRLFEDQKGRIWSSSMLGYLCYFEQGKIKHYKYNALLQRSLPAYKYAHSFYVDGLDNLYYGSYGNGLIEITSQGKISMAKHKGFANSINLKKHREALLTSMSLNESQNMKSGSRIEYLYNNLPISSSSNNLVRSEAFILSDSIICYSQPYSVVLYNIYRKKVTQTIEFSNKVSGIDFNGQDEVFIFAQNSGAKIYRSGDGELIEQQSVLAGHTVTSCLNDSEGGYWLTTTQNGIFYTPSRDILSYTEKNGLQDNYIIGLTTHNDSVAIAYENSLQLLYGEKLLGWPERASGSAIKYTINDPAFHQNGCELYYGLQKQKFMNVCTGFIYPGNKVTALSAVKYHNDILYIFTKTKGVRIVDNELKPIDLKPDLPRIVDVEIIDENEFWIGTINGLFRKTPNKQISMAAVDELFSRRVVDMERTTNYSLIVATRGAGIILLEKDSIINISTENGLLSNDVNTLFVDEQENIWVATNSGLHRIDGRNLENIDYYTIKEGLISNEITSICTNEGKAYVGTKKGLSLIHLDTYKKDNSSVDVTLISVKLNDSSIGFNDVIDIYPEDRFLEIEYLGINFHSFGNIQYKYRISELSDEWQYTFNRELKLQMFPDRGTYTIEFKARKLPDGEWSEQAQVVKLKFHPPFYKTWWFLVGVFCVLLILLYGAFKANILVYNRQIQQEIMNRILKKLGARSFLTIEEGRRKVRINMDDILFVEAFKDYVEIRTKKKKYLYRSTMKNMEQRLASMSFIRVHRSFIVQKNKIDSIAKDELVIESYRIPIGVTYRKKIKELQELFSRLNS